jgi:uncharacterized membrane protein YhaH (DUF805 family)
MPSLVAYLERPMLNILRKRLSFNGRASAEECGLVISFNLFMALVATLSVDQVMGLLGRGGLGAGVVPMAVILPSTLLSIAPAVRRLHDTGRSGLWLLLALGGPVALVLLVMLSEAGDEGPNAYGATPAPQSISLRVK